MKLAKIIFALPLLAFSLGAQSEQAFEYKKPSLDLRGPTEKHLIFQKKKADLARLERLKPYSEHFDSALAYVFDRVDEIEKRRHDLFLTPDLLAYCIDLDSLTLGYGIYRTQTAQTAYERHSEYDYMKTGIDQLERCLGGQSTRADMQGHVKFDNRYSVQTSFRKHKLINEEIRSAQTGFGPVESPGDPDYWPIFGTNMEDSILQQHIRAHAYNQRANYFE